jgi:hypothetical protein
MTAVSMANTTEVLTSEVNGYTICSCGQKKPIECLECEQPIRLRYIKVSTLTFASGRKVNSYAWTVAPHKTAKGKACKGTKRQWVECEHEECAPETSPT